MAETIFHKLNNGWNADPNAPSPEYAMCSGSLWVQFKQNLFQFPKNAAHRHLRLEFTKCSRFRFLPINDESWFAGDCRFSGKAPEWGEFYQIKGNFLDVLENTPWTTTGVKQNNTNNFLFYFRDETLECSAVDWKLHQGFVDDDSYKEPFV